MLGIKDRFATMIATLRPRMSAEHTSVSNDSRAYSPDVVIFFRQEIVKIDDIARAQSDYVMSKRFRRI